MSECMLSNGILTLRFSTLGAELMSVRDRDGVERLWQGDPAFWAGRAPILFPIAGGLKDDRYTLRGKTYQMPKHGFARKREFETETATEDSVTFLLTGEAGFDPGFPFDYALRVRYALRHNALEVRYTVTNLGDESFCYGLGAHEGYACPEGVAAYDLVFDEEETLRAHPLHGNLIARDTVTVLERGRVLPLRDDFFRVDALVFTEVRSRGVTLRSRLHPRTVRVDFPGFDALLLWTKPGAKYLCIEPWLNAPDFVDADGDITHKPGVVTLSPGESDARTHTITFA